MEWSRGALFVIAGLSASTIPAAAGDIPPVTDAVAPLFTGRWDFVPTIAPDALPVDVVVVPSGDVWIATEGALLRRTAGQSAVLVSYWADGSDAPLPSIIAHDMIAIDDERVLVSTIWREVFVAGPEGLVEVSPRDVRGAYSFVNLPDGRIAVAENDIRMDDTVVHRIEAATGREALFAGTGEALAVVGNQLFSVSDGTLTRVDSATGERGARLEYADVEAGISAMRPTEDGRLLIAATPHYKGEGCYLVDPGGKRETIKLFDGACYDIVQVGADDFWASTSNGIFRFDGSRWYRYFSDAPNGLGRQAKFARTETGSLWVASTLGLWRHYIHTRQVQSPADGRIKDLHRDRKGRLFLSDATGAVYLRDGNIWRQLLPKRHVVTYSRLPRMADGPDGSVMILHPDGLFRLDGDSLVKMADAPATTNTVAPATFAVCPDGTAFVGFAWSTDVQRLDGKSWIRDNSLAGRTGGSATADLDCDAEGYLWALGTETVAMRARDGKWYESETFDLRSNAKANLFGTLLPNGNKTATAWGPWGSAVEVSLAGEALSSRDITLGPEAPYIFHDAERYGATAAVLTDRGVYLWNGEQLRRLPLVEERLQRVATAMAGAPDDDTAFGFRLAVGSGGALFDVAPKAYRPQLGLNGPSDVIVRDRFATLAFDLDDRAYPVADGVLEIAFTGSVPEGFARTVRTDGRVSLTGLPPDQTLTFSARFTDAAGQISAPVTGTVFYDRPLEENPIAWAAIAFAVVIGLVMLARSPAAVDLVVRRFGRRRWQVVRGTVDRTVTLTRDDAGHLRGEISAEGATLKLAAESDAPFAIDSLKAEVRHLSFLTGSTRTSEGQKTFSRALDAHGRSLTSSLPDTMAFELQSLSDKTIVLDLERDLAAFPWDCMIARGGSQIFASNWISRVVRTDRVAAHGGLTGKLRAAVFTADAGSAPEARVWGRESDFVIRALKSAGVLQVSHLSSGKGGMRLEDWLDGTDIVHFTGHASVESDGLVRFWYAPEGWIGADQIRSCLNECVNPPALVFINACGSLGQTVDIGGAALAGLATPFLEVGATVIGTQWPVQTVFSHELAIAFYERALPPANSLVWRLLRRRPLEGMPFARALGDARRQMMRRRPATDPTWSSYTIYGDPTAKLSLL